MDIHIWYYDPNDFLCLAPPLPPMPDLDVSAGGSAAFDLQVIGPITGPAAGVAWKLYETSAQLSSLEQMSGWWSKKEAQILGKQNTVNSASRAISDPRSHHESS